MNWKKFSKIVVLFSLTGFLIGFIYDYHIPKLRHWLLLEIENQSHEHLPVKFQSQSLQFNLFPPSVSIYDVQMTPNATLHQELAPATLREVRVTISPWSLLKGEFKIQQIKVIGSSLKYVQKKPFASRVQKSKTPEKKSASAMYFNLLKDLPLRRLTLEDVDVYTKDLSGLLVHIKSLSLDIKIKRKSIWTTIETEEISFKKKEVLPILTLGGFVGMEFSENKIQIFSLEVTKDRSFLVASGEITGDLIKIHKYDSLNINAKGSLNLEDLSRLSREVLLKKEVPPASGNINFNVHAKHKRRQEPKLKINLKANNTYINGFELGNWEVSGANKGQGLEVSFLKGKNSGARVSIEHLKIQLKDSYAFSGNLQVHQLELKRFLNAMKIKNTPLRVDIKGALGCKGNIKPAFQLNCNADLKSPLLHVYTQPSAQKSAASKPSTRTASPSQSTIVKLKEVYAKGTLRANQKEVQYQADIGFPSAEGKTTGLIEFNKGFQIQYEGDIKDLSKLEISNLELKGSASLKGTTQNNDPKSTFKMDLRGKNASIKDWPIGSTRLKINYHKGQLKLNQTSGKLHSTSYNGSLSFNFPKKQVFLFFKSPNLDADTLNYILKDKYNLNPRLHGSGTVQLRLWGPLDKPSELSYKLNSGIQKGSIYGESFKELKINVSADKGRVKANEFFIKKRAGALDVSGVIQPNGDIDATLRGSRISIEEMDTFQNIGLNITGKFNFTSKFSGSVKSPVVKTNGTLSGMTMGDHLTEVSSFEIEASKEKVFGTAQFAGKVIDSKFNIPLSGKKPLDIQIQTTDWNFARFFSIFSKSVEEKNFNSKLTSELTLSSKDGNFWKSSGHSTISELELQRGPISMSATNPIHILFNNGVMTSDNFTITGDGTFIKFQPKASTPENLKLSVDGTVDLSLGILLTPFLDELSGKLSFSTQVLGSVDNPSFQGSASLKEGLVQVQKFPHPLENLSADFVFSEKSLLLNSLTAQLAGGKVQAWGKSSFFKINDIPIDIKAQFKDANINFPKGFKTKGEGRIHLYGKKIPYTLSGDYTITQGSLTQEVDFSKNGSLATVKPSVFLPESGNATKLQPIKVDFSIQTKEPIDIKTRFNTSDVNTKVGGKVKISGPYKKALLNGKLETQKGGTVVFRSNTFDIKTGRITYKNAPPDNPNILVSATTRVEDIDVNLMAHGSAKAPKIFLTSTPPLPEHDIISLLVFGFTSKTSDHLSQGSLDEENKKKSTFQAASAILNEQLGLTREINDQLGVKVDISSSYDKTLGTTIPSVIARKQWTPNFGASISRTIGNTTPINLLRTEYRVNKNISLIGSFEQKENEAREFKEDDSDILGLDLEYRLEFNLNNK